MDTDNKKEEFKKLNYEIMRLEISKMDIENTYELDKKYYGYDKAKPTYEYSINQADVESYRLGTKFYKLRHELYEEGKLTVNELVGYYDATLIAAIHLIRQYGLEYPECTVEQYGEEVLSSDEIVDGLYAKFLLSVVNLLSSGSITEFEKNRLFLAAEYLHRRNKYYLHEQYKKLVAKQNAEKDTIKLEKKIETSKNE